MLTLMSCNHCHLVVLLWRIVTGVKAVHKDGVVLAGDIFHHCSLVFAFKTVNEDRVRVVIDGRNIDRHLVILLRNSCFLLDLHLDLLRLVVLDQVWLGAGFPNYLLDQLSSACHRRGLLIFIFQFPFENCTFAAQLTLIYR